MKRWLILIFLAAAVTCAPARADEPWRFQLTPYVWGPSVSGDIEPARRLPPVSLDRSLGDVLADLEGAFFLNGTARTERLVLLGDFTWARLSETHHLTLPPTAVTPPLGIEATGKVTLTSFTLAMGYTAVKQPDVVLDLFGGMRGWRVRASVAVPHPLPFLPTSASETRFWVDPVIAARTRFQISPAWSFIGYADVGGFGAGSELTWQAVGTINYELSERFYLSAGYRHMALDYEEDALELDLDLSGPLIGATFLF